MKRSYLLLLAAIFAWVSVPALAGQDGKSVEDLRSNFEKAAPQLLSSPTNSGTDFWLSFPACYDQGGSGDNSCRIYVSSGVAQEVTVEIPGRGVLETKTVGPNQVVEWKLGPAMAQPYTKLPNQEPPTDQVWAGAGVNVRASAPIIVYGVTRFNFTSDGFLAVPSSSLGKEYIVNTYADMSAMYNGLRLPAETTITAIADNTVVTFTLGGNDITETAAGLVPGQTMVKTLNKGDVLAISTITDEGDLSGSKIRANKPVAVVSGNQCANVPTIMRWCDFIVEMELPTQSWGTAYHVTQMHGRQKNSMIKILASKPNTVVSRDGQEIGIIDEAGGVEGVGFLHMRVSNGEVGNFIISANNPISVTQYNPGQEDDNVVSDPFQLILTPIEQFQTEITFMTPGISGNGFSSNYLNVVYELDENGAIPDHLEFGIVQGTEVNWAKVKDAFGSAPGKFFSAPVEGRNFAMKELSLPGDGVYKLRSETSFASYSYGFSNYDSYGFPTSVALGNLEVNDPDPPLSPFEIDCSTGEVYYEDQEGNIYTDIVVRDYPSVENETVQRSNLAIVRFETTQNYILEVDEFVPGVNETTKWRAFPEDASKYAYAEIMFMDQAGNVTRDTLEYEPFSLSFDPEGPIDMGWTKPGGAELRKRITLKNASDDYVSEIGEFIFDSEYSDLFTVLTFPDLVEPSLPLTIGQGEELDMMVIFDPTTVSLDMLTDSKLLAEASMIVSGVECGEDTLNIKAQVEAPCLVLSPVDVMNFGAQEVNGPEKTRTFTMTNTAEFVTLVLESVDISGSAEDMAQFDVRLPVELADIDNTPYNMPPGQTLTVTVAFEPTVKKTDFTIRIKYESSDLVEEACEPTKVVMGSGTLGAPIVNNLDWDRNRVKFAPYPHPTDQLVLENIGDSEVQITDITATGDVTAFTIGGANIDAWANAQTGINLQNGNPKMWDVEFNPSAIGDYAAQINFFFNDEDNEEQSVTAALTGTGTIVEVTATGYDYVANNGGAGFPISTGDDGGEVVFTVSSSEYHEPAVVVGVAGLVGAPDFELVPGLTEVTMNGNTYAFDDAGINETVNPGDQIVISNIRYTATTPGPVEADADLVYSVTNSPDSTMVAKLTSTGLADRLQLSTSDFALKCLTDFTFQDAIVLANGPGDVEVYDIRLSNTTDFELTGEWTLEDVSGTPIQQPTYTPGQTIVIPDQQIARFEVRFKRDGTLGTVTTDVEVENSTFSDPVLTDVISGENQTIDVATRTVVKNPGNDADVSDIVPGINYHVVSGTLTEVSETYNVRSIEVRFVYNYMAFQRVGNASSVFPIAQVDENPLTAEMHEVIYTLTVPAGEVIPQGELIRVPLLFLLHTPRESYDFDVSYTMYGQDQSAVCAALLPSDVAASVVEVCLDDVRPVDVATGDFTLDPIHPNPVVHQADINYSVAYDIFTTLTVYNELGEEVLVPVNQRMPQGDHTLKLNVKDLPSGTYHVRLEAGPYVKSIQMVISK